MDTHNIDICPIERYGYALKSVRDISRICEEEMRESNHMRDITHLYPTILIDISLFINYIIGQKWQTPKNWPLILSLHIEHGGIACAANLTLKWL